MVFVGFLLAFSVVPGFSSGFPVLFLGSWAFAGCSSDVLRPQKSSDDPLALLRPPKVLRKRENPPNDTKKELRNNKHPTKIITNSQKTNKHTFPPSSSLATPSSLGSQKKKKRNPSKSPPTPRNAPETPPKNTPFNAPEKHPTETTPAKRPRNDAEDGTCWRWAPGAQRSPLPWTFEPLQSAAVGEAVGGWNSKALRAPFGLPGGFGVF